MGTIKKIDCYDHVGLPANKESVKRRYNMLFVWPDGFVKIEGHGEMQCWREMQGIAAVSEKCIP